MSVKNPKIDRKNEKLLEYKSIALNELDRIDEAYECLEQIAEINHEKKKWLAEIRKNPEIQRCDKLMENGDYRLALEYFTKALEIDPKNKNARYNAEACINALE